MADFDRRILFPERQLPDAGEIIEQGQSAARTVAIGKCAFLDHYGVTSEAEYKRSCASGDEIMVHSQIGYRDPEKSLRAYREIWQRVTDKGARVDRYGICLDWSMGFRQSDRTNAQQGTGLVLPSSEAFCALTDQAPVAPHFGDFVLGMPAAFENTCAALRAGSTAIGNLGQYFTFRLPGWHDDVGDTASTLKALALIAAQPVEVLVHSNLDDGFAALFTDLACGLGAVMLEQYIVDDLIGASASHCYGHSFSEPYKRLVFQLALAEVSDTPGTMVYGNTVMYDGDDFDNYAALANYLTVDAVAQRVHPSGHAINPVPVTEATRIPDIGEVADAAVFASRVVGMSDDYRAVMRTEQAVSDARELIDAAGCFKDKVLMALGAGGVDTTNPLELLLALRRIGAEKLEQQCGPGIVDTSQRRGRQPVLQSSTIARLEQTARDKVALASDEQREIIRNAGLRLCICTTDVHEYGKILLEETLDGFGILIVDAGIHAEPLTVAGLVKENTVDAIAVSTYNGIAMDYLNHLVQALAEADCTCPVLMGGRMNQILPESRSSLPVDVTGELAEAGVMVCHSIDDLLPQLLQLATQK